MRVALIGWLGFALACAPAGVLAKEPAKPLPHPSHAAPELVSPVKEPGAPSAAAAFSEELPPAGTGNMFSDAQIRYCLAQIIRIEAMRSLVNRYRKAQVEYFNVVTTDYNSRCGSYRYEGDTLEMNRALVEANRWQIQSSAREAYAKRFASDEKPAAAAKPAPPPQTEPPPAAASLPYDELPVPRSAQTAEAAPPSPPAKPPAAESRSPRAEQPVDSAQAAKPRPTSPPATESRSSRAAQPVQGAPAVPVAKPQPGSPPAVGSRAAPAERPTENPPPIPAAKPQPATPAAVESRPSRAEAPAESIATPAAKPRTTPPPAVESRAARDQPAAGQPAGTAESATAPPPPSTPRSAPPAVAAAPPSQSQPAPSPPPARKSAAETSPDAVWDRFARDVRRAGFQVVEAASYPETARDQDWEGTTQVDVHYAAGGFIKSIVVGESSGHPPLDERALQIARNLRFPDVPEELQARDFAVRFPIVFRQHQPR